MRSEIRNDFRPPARGQLIARLAGRQHGVVARTQLGVLGLDRSAIRRRVAAGSLHPLHDGRVYAVGLDPLSVPGQYLAAVMACGSGAVLSHRAAAGLWGLRPNPRNRHRPRRAQPDLRPHCGRGGSGPRQRSAWGPSAPAGNRGLRTEHPEKRPGAALQGATRNRTRHTDPSFNAAVEGEQATHEVDAFWPDRQLAVQLDGFEFHRTRRDRERDATSDADLELAGRRVMRLTWDDVAVHAERTLRRLRLAGA